MRRRDPFTESINLAKLLSNPNYNLVDIWHRWINLRNRLLKDYYGTFYAAKKYYDLVGAATNVKDREDLSNTLVYYSDRWHFARVLAADIAFKEVMKNEINSDK